MWDLIVCCVHALCASRAAKSCINASISNRGSPCPGKKGLLKTILEFLGPQ